MFQRLGVMLVVSLLLLGVIVTNVARYAQASSNKRQGLTFEDRVAAQWAIEEVYWRHRIWPEDNPTPKPSLTKVMPEPAIRTKVEDYLRKSLALDFYWQRPITSEELQAEMERMAQQTMQPDVLRELWAALNDDPLLIAECLVRPLLVERLSRERYAKDDRFHGELKRRAGSELNELGGAGQMRRTSGEYHEVDWIKDETEAAAHSRGAKINGVLRVSAEQWQEQVSKLAGRLAATKAEAELPIGQWSSLQENEERFFAVAVVEKGNERMKVASVVWKKVSFDEWWNGARVGMGWDISAPSTEYQLPEINVALGSCDGDAWTATSTTSAPSARNGQATVWTGNEMIVWGGWDNVSSFSTGGRYTPATDTWIATSTTGAPEARSLLAGVWTGTEMVVWGGSSGTTRLNTGGRYTVTSGLTISPASQSFPANGGSGSVNVTSPSSCAWTVTSNASWITITSGSSGAGSGTVNYSVAANTAASSRTGTITITGQTFTVNQAGGNACQTVIGLSSTSGAVGSSLTITGANFTGVNAVKFTNNVSASFTVNSDTQITTTVPSGAVTGPITISKPNCPDAITAIFTVGTSGNEVALISGMPQTGSISAPSPGGGVLSATQYTITVPGNCCSS